MFIFVFCFLFYFTWINMNSIKQNIAEKKIYTKTVETIKSLMNDPGFLADCELIRKMSLKIALRLRNSIYSQTFNQLKKWLQKLQNSFKNFKSDQLDDQMKQRYQKAQIKPILYNPRQLDIFSSILFKIFLLSTKACRLSKVWLDLGQLTSYFLITFAISSRICVFAKASMVYLGHILDLVIKNFDKTDEFDLQNKFENYFKKMEIKSGTEEHSNDHSLMMQHHSNDAEDLGVKIGTENGKAATSTKNFTQQKDRKKSNPKNKHRPLHVTKKFRK
ncbi:lisH domain and HEAT repeat-containing protein [Sarcoptes scabiei]|nr:lisH domain and HEAT repeat-containing protein [Sarcoptes scabiei]